MPQVVWLPVSGIIIAVRTRIMFVNIDPARATNFNSLRETGRACRLAYRHVIAAIAWGIPDQFIAPIGWVRVIGIGDKVDQRFDAIIFSPLTFHPNGIELDGIAVLFFPHPQTLAVVVTSDVV